MGDSGIKSAFQFESFKIDKVNFKSKPNIGWLRFKSYIPNEEWDFNISFRQPLFFQKESVYIGGMDAHLILKDSGEKDAEPFVDLEAGIAGVFAVEDDNTLSDKAVEGLVKIQIPALLLPYLRGAITSLLANAGFGAIVLPLFNIHEAAKNGLISADIRLIE